jgi:hypothetical protein
MRSVIFLFIGICGFSFSVFAQPKISIDKTSIEYGKLPYGGANLKSYFTVTNIGNEPLIITRVSTGDGGFMCHSYPREPILPNKSAEIVFLYDTKRIGPFNKTGYIYSNAVEPDLYIRIKGEIIPSPVAYFEKKEVNFGTLEMGDKGTFDLLNNGTALLKIKKIESINHSVDLNYPFDTLSRYGEMKLIFYPKANKDSANFEYKWNVYTNESNNPKVLTAKGKINFSPLSFDTATVFLKPSESGTRFFTVKCYNAGSEEIEVYMVSKGEHSEQIWLPSKQIYYSEGEKYTIPAKGEKTLIVAYQSFESLPPEEKITFHSVNKKSNQKYRNVVWMKFKMQKS